MLKDRYKYLELKSVFRKYTHVGTADTQSDAEEQQDSNIVHGSYGALLFDPRWQNKRLSILNRDAHRCVLCSSTSDLQVHHRQYHFIKAKKEFSPPWEYDDRLLLTLCEKCHQKGHRQYKVPTKYIRNYGII